MNSRWGYRVRCDDDGGRGARRRISSSLTRKEQRRNDGRCARPKEWRLWARVGDRVPACGEERTHSLASSPPRVTAAERPRGQLLRNRPGRLPSPPRKRILERVVSEDKRLRRDPTTQRRFILVEGLYRNYGDIVRRASPVALPSSRRRLRVLSASRSGAVVVTRASSVRAAPLLTSQRWVCRVACVALSSCNSLVVL